MNERCGVSDNVGKLLVASIGLDKRCQMCNITAVPGIKKRGRKVTLYQPMLVEPSFMVSERGMKAAGL